MVLGSNVSQQDQEVNLKNKPIFWPLVPASQKQLPS
uniref:Uncharacterized protein n=1 Tax=Anguilla anguilla TaxID=7936 RepID=A0A0E9U0S5_ANGAN